MVDYLRLHVRRRRPALLQRRRRAGRLRDDRHRRRATRSSAARTRSPTSATATRTTTSSAARASRTSSASCCAAAACASKLSFSKRKALAADRRQVHAHGQVAALERTQMLSLLKLGLGVADKPVQQVTVRRRAGSRTTATTWSPPTRRSSDTLDQFLHPKTVTVETAKKAPTKSTIKSQEEVLQVQVKKSKLVEHPVGARRHRGPRARTSAIAVNRRLRFPFYYPKLGATGTALRQRRRARLPHQGPTTRYYQAYRLVPRHGRQRAAPSTTASRA